MLKMCIYAHLFKPGQTNLVLGLESLKKPQCMDNVPVCTPSPTGDCHNKHGPSTNTDKSQTP